MALSGINDEEGGFHGKVDTIDHGMLQDREVPIPHTWKAYRGSHPGERFETRGSHLPLSVLICAEAFSSLLNHVESNGSLEGVRICNQAPCFNHLLFVDDSLILLKVTHDSPHHLQNILNLYEECSG